METKQNIRRRIHLIDDIRGITIISMVAFHISYDLAYLYGLPMAWFTIGPLQDIWRCSISWTFLFIAGWSTSFSRSNLKRGCLYTAMALLVWLATTVASVDTPVNYGILFCMGASTFLYCCVEKLAQPPADNGNSACCFCLKLPCSENDVPGRASCLARLPLPRVYVG